MSSTRSGLKRHVLQQAVNENVDVLHGRRPQLTSKPRRMLIRVYKPLLFVALFGVLAVSYLVREVAQQNDVIDNSMIVDLSTYPPGTDFDSIRKQRKEMMLSRLSFPTPRPVSRSVLPVQVRTIVVDAGHGGENFGTSSRNGLLEKTFTLDIATRLERLLTEQSFRVIMTRDDDASLTLQERIDLANRRNADVFVSIHLNWFQNDSAQGVETFYLGPSEDATVERLAAQENVDSGYTVADVRGLLEELYLDVRQDESRRLAEYVQNRLYSAHRAVNSHISDRGVKRAPFVVLIGTEMPAILTEVSYLSNKGEVERLQDPDYRETLAQSLSDGIQAYADSLYNQKETTENHQISAGPVAVDAVESGLVHRSANKEGSS